MVTTQRILAYLLIPMLAFATSTSAQKSPVDPHKFYQRVMSNPNLRVQGRITGEGFCWHAAAAASDFVKGYQAWDDPAWIEYGQVYFDWLISLMETGPDGYKGWVGHAAGPRPRRRTQW